MVNAIVVSDLLPLGDPPLGNHEDLVAVRVDPQGVRLTRVVQQQQGGEHRTSQLSTQRRSQCCGSITFWCGSVSADPCL
jgi:hypothetical protein